MQPFPIRKHYIQLLVLSILVQCSLSCKKLVEIPEPVDTLTTPEVFSSEADANSAIAGVYSTMQQGLSFCNGNITILCGLSSDELQTYYLSNIYYAQFQNNILQSSNDFLTTRLWQIAYSTIYKTNAIISGLAQSNQLRDSIKNALTGQAKFIRAFHYFYLLNTFGNIPLALTTDWTKTAGAANAPPNQVYQQILSDLSAAAQLLPNDYSATGGERITPIKWSAIAFLAKVNLYMKNWADAEKYATQIISNNQLYNLADSPQHVFLSNSTEAIWQMKPTASIYPYNATEEGLTFVPFNNTSIPYFFLSPSLINVFEPNDLRWSNWVSNTVYQGSTYYYPYKYTIGPAQTLPNATAPQYYMMERLGEQYLIRAEARAQQNDLSNAITDIDTIRKRANLPNTSAASQSDILSAIYHERQIELFAEWGNRWMDLNRTNLSSAVLKPLKPQWNNNAKLYPIPIKELILDPNLKQNPGY